MPKRNSPRPVSSRFGERYGFLTVLPVQPERRTHPSGKSSTYVYVRCDCGNEKFVQLSAVCYGDAISCGCSLGGESRKRKVSLVKKVHGYSRTKTHDIWKGMKKRCSNRKEESYPHYGGRGIVVCHRWLNFENFLADMGECPDGFSIERIDVDGDYEPGNCKWIPREDQPLNRRYNKLVILNGNEMLFSHALKLLGVTKQAGNSTRIRRQMDHQQVVDFYVARGAR